jgi:hypothetical protein
VPDSVAEDEVVVTVPSPADYVGQKLSIEVLDPELRVSDRASAPDQPCPVDQDALLTVDMLKSGTRTAGIAVRRK